MDIEVLLESFDGAFAPNTLRAYRADFAQFALWCAERRQDPWQIGGESLAPSGSPRSLTGHNPSERL